VLYRDAGGRLVKTELRGKKLAMGAVALLIVGSAVVLGGRPPTSGSGAVTLTARLASATQVARVSNGSGYWLVASDGGVFTFGTAHFYGSMAGKHLNSPITGIVATPDDHGYWLVAEDGGVFAFGDAVYSGSMGGKKLHAPVKLLSMSSPSRGYGVKTADKSMMSHS